MGAQTSHFRDITRDKLAAVGISVPALYWMYPLTALFSLPRAARVVYDNKGEIADVLDSNGRSVLNGSKELLQKINAQFKHALVIIPNAREKFSELFDREKSGAADDPQDAAAARVRVALIVAIVLVVVMLLILIVYFTSSRTRTGPT